MTKGQNIHKDTEMLLIATKCHSSLWPEYEPKLCKRHKEANYGQVQLQFTVAIGHKIHKVTKMLFTARDYDSSF